MPSWDSIDTVLLDMDGTLLDLKYDNTLWNQLVPERYSKAHGLTLEEAEAKLFARMREIRGKLSFYCLDYWSEYTQLDIVGLHHELVELIEYRPNAEMFLAWLRDSNKSAVLVTNAHRDSLFVKNLHSQVTSRLDADVSCHDYGSPKEAPHFWSRLRLDYAYDPARTLLIDDNASVLSAAKASGIAHLVTITQPDSSRPSREHLDYPAFNDFREIIPLG